MQVVFHDQKDGIPRLKRLAVIGDMLDRMLRHAGSGYRKGQNRRCGLSFHDRATRSGRAHIGLR